MIFMEMHKFKLINQKLNLKGYFRPLVMTRLFKNRISTKKFRAKLFMKMRILTYWPKAEFRKIFLTSGGCTFVRNLISYTNVRMENLHKNAWMLTYRPKTDIERFFSGAGWPGWNICSKFNFHKKKKKKS